MLTAELLRGYSHLYAFLQLRGKVPFNIPKTASKAQKLPPIVAAIYMFQSIVLGQCGL